MYAVKVGDVEINHHFFIQASSSHPIILGKPYIIVSSMEIKVLDNWSAYARSPTKIGGILSNSLW